MKLHEYRKSVHSVQWSAKKRAKIEEALSKPVHAKSKASEWKEDWTNDIVVTHETVARVEARERKQRNMRRVLWIGIVAALLATGGAIGAVAGWAKQEHLLDQPPTSLQDGAVVYLTDEEGALPPNGLAGTYDERNMILPTEHGWYYFKTLVEDDPNAGDYFYSDGSIDSRMIWYADRETGETVPLCAKPNCLHDGNEFCVATTDAYFPGELTEYNGFLYTIGSKSIDRENGIDHQVLLRYAPDGTSITEVYDFGEGDGGCRPVFHRGYLWFFVQLRTYGEKVENPITHEQEIFSNGGWQLWGYELASGKVVRMYDATEDPDVNHVNMTPYGLTAAGDYLYYYRYGDDNSGNRGLSRLSLITGEETFISASERFTPLVSHTHAVIGEYAQASDTQITNYLVDLETLERTPIGRQDFVFMDDNYLYAESKAESNDENGTPHTVSIYDYEGNLVKEIRTPFMDYSILQNYEDGTFEQFIGGASVTGVQDGNLYLRVSAYGNNRELFDKLDYGVYFCSVEDLLNQDEPEWKFAYSDTPTVRTYTNSGTK